MKEYAYIHEEGRLPEPLNAVPFLNSFTDEQLDEVLNSSSLLQCDMEDVIIQEGAIDSRIYILLSGELEVRISGKKVAAITRVGDVFGELALVNQDKRAASWYHCQPRDRLFQSFRKIQTFARSIVTSSGATTKSDFALSDVIRDRISMYST